MTPSDLSLISTSMSEAIKTATRLSGEGIVPKRELAGMDLICRMVATDIATKLDFDPDGTARFLAACGVGREK